MNIPETVACIVGLNDNLLLDGRTVQVQTEDFTNLSRLVTNVLVEGACIHRVVRDYSQHLNNPNLPRNLCKAARVQHGLTVQRLPEILADYQVKQEPKATQADHQLTLLARVTWLFDLGCRLLKVDPQSAEITWQEVLEIDPNHRKALANINRLRWARQKANSAK